MNKIWFITGASQGFGLELVTQLLAKGDKVAATSRNKKSLIEKISPETDNFSPLSMKLDDEKSIKKAIEQTHEKFGRLDYIVNNAGHGQSGVVEEVSDKLARQLFDVNVFGTLNVIRQVAPYLRKQRSGYIFNFSSAVGFASVSGIGIYCASKFAVSAISEALKGELEPFGVKVINVMPSYFRTNFLAKSSFSIEDIAIDDYNQFRKELHVGLATMSNEQGDDPKKAIEVIIKVSAMKNPPLYLFIGKDAYQVAADKIDMVQNDMNQMRDIGSATSFD